ncbi:hypersensitive response-inducing protein [Colletotrichum graminicola]|uniref:Hypersensitive response-inducing protein n=1 Tax=Colletotrichum graminicola (strain M1.001 / M2 / FGSC 10212) TaxID=645133 RepID=E3Q4N3_COLGM|nr:hypersensitive response-inducing protein [Colletotrichum graminicola M1.001]EFQ26048.1 hypersensitive response-inducing protein [Colletotrichum graminicola M1.001]WDK23185.1 hypersensitive response-inducing protein [Colletotrichum graminicola]
MKFSVILSSAAVAAAAAVIDKSIVKFSVSDFGAGCLGHSTQCTIGFNVSRPEETIGVQCAARVSAIPGAGGPNIIPDIKGASCTNSTRTFDFVRNDGAATLTVYQQVSRLSFRTGSHVLPSSDFVITNEPNAWVESYTGPSAFFLE